MLFDWRRINRNFARILLLLVNGLCTLLALGTIVFALVDTQILKQYGEGVGSGTFIGDVIIVSACLYFVGVAAFGTIGVIKGNAKILYMYVAFLMVLAVVEIFIAVYVSVQKYGLQVRVSQWLLEDFYRNDTVVNTEQHEKFWDQMQITYKCCGLNGPEDYQLLTKSISVSCCPRAYCATTEYTRHQLYKACIESVSYYPVGCKDELLSVLRTDAEWLFAVAVTSFGLESTKHAGNIRVAITAEIRDIRQGAAMLLAMYIANHAKATAAVYKLKMPF